MSLLDSQNYGGNTHGRLSQKQLRQGHERINITSQQGFFITWELKPLTAGYHSQGQEVIDLGVYDKLIYPVKVDGNKWYYCWDLSGDGTSANVGSLNGGSDQVEHDFLDNIFTQNVNGNVGSSGNTNNTYRYATIANVKPALPTANGALHYPNSINDFNPVAQSTTVRRGRSTRSTTTYWQSGMDTMAQKLTRIIPEYRRDGRLATTGRRPPPRSVTSRSGWTLERSTTSSQAPNMFTITMSSCRCGDLSSLRNNLQLEFAADQIGLVDVVAARFRVGADRDKGRE